MTETMTRPATLDDLLERKGKCELIGGRIVEFPMPGDLPHEVAENIIDHLKAFVRALGRGRARGDGLDFGLASPLPSGRRSFRPDGSFYLNAPPRNRMKWIPGAPAFAIEVRSDTDYLPGADTDMAAKRADYFLAGTAVVWDVDTLAECIHVYRAPAPTSPMTYRRGQVAEAEPAVPGWTMPVDEIFGPPA